MTRPDEKWLYEVDRLRQLGSEGKTYQQIARLYGCSRQRIKQVISRLIPEWNTLYGKKIRDMKREEEFQKLKQHRQHKWGTEDRATETDLYWAQRKKFSIKRSNAKRIGQTWDLEFGDLEWPTHCPILGIELDYFVTSMRVESSPSFDQIIPGLGYIKGNVQVISWRANRLKNDGTWEDHLKIGEYLKKFDKS